ncbi:hypothetical protein GCM10009706_14610 [Curtobacterium citreum]|uniref:Uncharacterized protein n=1 Tax=Curtobacterium citreum TaxID=2036 RepID=A0ABT2HDI9_9MICO|nr:hypothetical protein [Curtobacterium citreum]MCS6521313.1 hypothetical protein [Curtobacterium citreum]TQJ28170.1 hypothetical protein FB462_2050 [Curtobacterium citreum]GGL77210.1 hypothetical protein GCM10009706_14610 [Curtobacterium citreum]
MTLPRWTPVRAAAFQGLQKAADELAGGGAQEYVALGTAVFWAATLDEQLRREHGEQYDRLRDKDPAGAVLPGIRLVRNGITHGAVVAVSPAGLQFPLEYPLNFGPLVYQSLESLLEDWIGDRHGGKANAQQDTVYRERFEGRTLMEPLWEAVAWFARLERAQWDIDVLQPGDGS